MPAPRQDAGGGSQDAAAVLATLGFASPPPSPPTAAPNLGAAPLVSTTPSPGQGVSLDVSGRLPSSVNQTIPGYEYAYVELNGGGPTLSIVGTSSGSPTSIVAAPAIVFDGKTTIVVSFFCYGMQKGTTSMTVGLYDSTSILTVIAYTETGWAPAGLFQRRLTPTLGLHTYGVKAFVNAGTGLIGFDTGASGLGAPAFIQIQRA